LKYSNEQKHLVGIGDVVFTVVIVAVALIIWFAAASFAKKGATVVFRHDGEIVGEASLDKNTIFKVEGDYLNIFEIKNGEVSVKYTDCPNHSCERMGAVDSAGSSIVCVPNNVTATIEGREAGIDAVTG